MKYYIRMKETNYYDLLIEAEDKHEAIAKAYDLSFMYLEVSKEGGMEAETVLELTETKEIE